MVGRYKEVGSKHALLLDLSVIHLLNVETHAREKIREKAKQKTPHLLKTSKYGAFLIR